MKPLIWFDLGGWNCCIDWSIVGAVWGFGHTPAEAYEDWHKRMGTTA